MICKWRFYPSNLGNSDVRFDSIRLTFDKLLVGPANYLVSTPTDLIGSLSTRIVRVLILTSTRRYFSLLTYIMVLGYTRENRRRSRIAGEEGGGRLLVRIMVDFGVRSSLFLVFGFFPFFPS